MSDFGEDDADYLCFTSVEEEGAEFCFGGGGEHVLDYCRENVDRSVEGWWSGLRVGREMIFFGREPRKKYPPARDRAPVSER